MVSTMGLVIEACFSPLIYSMCAGCHFSSAKLLCAKAEYLLCLICMVSALFPRLDCLWHIYLSTNCLSTWWDIPFGKMDVVLHRSASRLKHSWFLTECFFPRILCAFGCKANCTTSVRLAKKSLMLSEICAWTCGFASSEQLESSPCPRTLCRAVGALRVLVVRISQWCWWALAVLAAVSTGTFLLQWSSSALACLPLVSHSQFPKAFHPPGTLWLLWDLHPTFCLADFWVFPPVTVAATLIFWLNVVSELCFFLFTVNIL